jgi:hypothetical protein
MIEQFVEEKTISIRVLPYVAVNVEASTARRKYLAGLMLKPERQLRRGRGSWRSPVSQ